MSSLDVCDTSCEHYCGGRLSCLPPAPAQGPVSSAQSSLMLSKLPSGSFPKVLEEMNSLFKGQPRVGTTAIVWALGFLYS